MKRQSHPNAVAVGLLSLVAVAAVQLQRAEGRFRAGDDAELHYTALGEGRPILLLAGGPGFSGDYMRPVADALPGFRSIVLDQRGTGRSRLQLLDASTVNLAKAIADIEALRIHLAEGQLVVVGHSWGGMLAMAYAAEHPDRVRGLMLIGPGGPNLDFLDYFSSNIDSRLTAADREAVAFWSDPGRANRNGGRVAYEQFRAMLPGYVYQRRSALALIETLDVDSFRPRVNELMMGNLGTIGYDLTGRFETFDRPVLILQGRQDPVGESTAFQIQRMIRGADLQFIERCGHFPWIEQQDEFKREVARFLQALK